MKPRSVTPGSKPVHESWGEWTRWNRCFNDRHDGCDSENDDDCDQMQLPIDYHIQAYNFNTAITPTHIKWSTYDSVERAPKRLELQYEQGGEYHTCADVSIDHTDSPAIWNQNYSHQTMNETPVCCEAPT